MEFAQYRAYEPGDEPRQIDWKLYARSDKFFVREAERDSPLTAWVVLDATASMAQTDAARPGWSGINAVKNKQVLGFIAEGRAAPDIGKQLYRDVFQRRMPAGVFKYIRAGAPIVVSGEQRRPIWVPAE